MENTYCDLMLLASGVIAALAVSISLSVLPAKTGQRLFLDLTDGQFSMHSTLSCLKIRH